jgi:chloramphenicol 3-O phosphotransferase
MAGKIILLNGASSSGKSTLARGLQAMSAEPFWHVSVDHLHAAGVLPEARIRSREFPWPTLRPRFFDGYHRCLPVLAEAGNNLVVDRVIETEDWMRQLLELLGRCGVFFVGVHRPLAELERRERERGDSRIGEARHDYETTHEFGRYDFEMDTTRRPAHDVDAVVPAWKDRQRPGAFAKMAQRIGPA